MVSLRYISDTIVLSSTSTGWLEKFSICTSDKLFHRRTAAYFIPAPRATKKPPREAQRYTYPPTARLGNGVIYTPEERHAEPQPQDPDSVLFAFHPANPRLQLHHLRQSLHLSNPFTPGHYITSLVDIHHWPAKRETPLTTPPHPSHPDPLPSPPHGRPPAATAKIATKSGHKQRSSLLGGGGGTSYQPLSGASSLASAHQPYIPGGYHDRNGLPTTTSNNARAGKSSMYIPNSRWTWSFFGIALLQAIVCLGLEAYVFAEFETSLRPSATATKSNASRTIPTYLAIFIFGFFYQLVLVWDGLRARNTIQVIGLCIYNLGMMIYAAVEMDQVNEAVTQLGDMIDTTTWRYLEPCLIAVPCVLALGTVLMSGVAWKLYDEFAWTIYKHISADLRLKRRYLQYQIYIALLKFDFFFFVGFTVQFLVIVHGPNFEFALTIAALVITVLLLFLAAYICRRESYVGQSIIILLYFAGMAYFVFKLVRMYAASTEDLYRAARHSLTTFAVITITLLIATMAAAVLCMMNFKKGLQPHLRKGTAGKGEEVGYAHETADPYAGGQHQLGNVPNRMTID